MRKKKVNYEQIVDRAVAAALTLGFMAIVRPDPAPTLLASATVALIVYEGLLYCIRYIVRMKRRSDRYTTLVLRERYRQEARNVANTRLRRSM